MNDPIFLRGHVGMNIYCIHLLHYEIPQPIVCWTRFEKIKIDFDTPQPREQSLIFKTANEISKPIIGEPTGKIPDWLKGTLLKNGPGLFEFGDQYISHLFDGMAMIRRYHIGKLHGRVVGTGRGWPGFWSLAGLAMFYPEFRQ